MNTKKIMSFTLLGIWSFLLVGCTAQPENIENNITANEKQQKVVNAEYVVDPSDMLDTGTLVAAIATSSLSDAEKAWLVQMREEEKLARDVYTTLGNLWNIQTFGNIAKSEQTHTNAIKTLLDRYMIADPVTVDTVGIFTSPVMQKLYTDLVAQGSTSLLDALKVGATVEDLDIKDLEDLMQTTDNEDILLVYANLTKWSRNHLRAFVSNISRNNWTYSPQYISQASYDEIINGQQERGNVQWNTMWNWMRNGMGGGRWK